MNLPHHRHHPPGRDLEWLLPVLIPASAMLVTALVVAICKALA
jgi:hypothetical protein